MAGAEAGSLTTVARFTSDCGPAPDYDPACEAGDHDSETMELIPLFIWFLVHGVWGVIPPAGRGVGRVFP